MNNWSDMKARRDATRKLCEHLDGNRDARAACLNDPAAARKMLANMGDFCLEENLPAGSEVEPIPTALPVFFYEDPSLAPTGTKVNTVKVAETGNTDNLVLIVLPAKLPPPAEFDPTEVWRCTYQPWVG